MKIRLTRNTIVDGEHRSEGQKVDTDEHSAKYLIAIGKAIALDPVEPDRDRGDALVETALKPDANTAGGKGKGGKKR